MKVDTFHIGPHSPSLKTEDVHLVHRLWLNITREPGLGNVHHHDILTEALTRFAREYAGRDREDILRDLRKTAGSTVTTRSIETQPLGRPRDEQPPPKSGKGGKDGPPSPPVVTP